MEFLKQNFKKILSTFGLVFLALLISVFSVGCSNKEEVKNSQTTTENAYKVSEEEKAQLKEKFDGLTKINSEAIAYVYAPGTMLDEPIVQTSDNETYLDKTFEGGHQPEFGTVFMDTDNKKNFSDKLTWLFGHARGSNVPDSRMFNDVNLYDNQDFFDKHPYVVVETPERKYYYEAAFLIIVPENTAFYRTEFDSDSDFAKQLTEVSKEAQTKNPNIKIDSSDRYLVLSTCREEDVTIRSNFYLRQIPDKELPDFLKQNEDKLKYVKTR